MLKRVNPRIVPVVPAELDAVAADRLEASQGKVLRNKVFPDKYFPRPFIDAARAAAVEAERTKRVKTAVSVFPDNEDLVRTDRADIERLHKPDPGS